MRLSELAKQIIDYIAENGDVEVKVENQNGDHRCDYDPELDIVECRYASYKFIRL